MGFVWHPRMGGNSGSVNSSLAMLKHKLQFVHTHVGIIPDFSGLNRVEAKLKLYKGNYIMMCVCIVAKYIPCIFCTSSGVKI